MFDNLSEKLQSAFKSIRGHGKLSEQNIKEALKEVRMALLEADVNFRVVKDFTERVRKRAIGRGVLKSLTPGQQLIQVALLGYCTSATMSQLSSPMTSSSAIPT